MAVKIISKEQQGQGAFNGGEIVENHPIGFPQNGGEGKPFSSLFYWAHAKAKVDSTIGLHPHQGFEIMSFVLKGHIRHYDTKLKEWRQLEAGDAQIIRAGNGISHAEFMAKDSAMFQIWMDPDLRKTMSQAASYDDYKAVDLPVKQAGDVTIKTFVGEDSIFKMDTQDVEIQRYEFEKANYTESILKDKVYSIYVLEGSATINGEEAALDDFVLVSEADELKIESEKNGVLFVISTPKKLGYQTYAEIMEERMRA